MTITKEQAEELLRKDVETFEKELNAVVKVPLTQNQFDALISFVYNIGISKFKNSKVLKLINDKRFDEAAEELLKWNKAINQFKQYVVVPGLVRRRKDEYLLFKGEVS
jgi:lysozyme